MPLKKPQTEEGPVDLLAMNAMAQVLAGIDAQAAAEARLILAIETERMGRRQAESGNGTVPNILRLVPDLARGWKRGARQFKALAGDCERGQGDSGPGSFAKSSPHASPGLVYQAIHTAEKG